MGFSNDEEGDGLAALFGGITPTPAAPDEPGPRRAARARADAPSAPAPTDGSSPAPTSFPLTSFSPPSLPSYPQGSPSFPPSPPAWAPPAPSPPALSLPAPQGPRSYDLPPPAASPSLPAWSPPPAPQSPAPQSPAPQSPARHGLPAPAGAAPVSAGPPAPGYPPTVQYPAASGVPAVSAPPQGTADAPPLARPASYPPPTGAGHADPARAPALLEEPPAAAAPPVAPTRHDSPPLGYAASGRPLSSERQDGIPPVAPPGGHPLVLSEPALPASVFPRGPLLPSSAAPVDTPEDIERSTALEKVGLALALLTGPIGLTLAIVNAVRSARRRGWVIGIVRASLVLGVLSTSAAAIAGSAYANMRADQIAHAEIAAASAEFCAAAEADPAMVTPPTLGWPAPAASVGESITLMQAWTDRWTALAPGAPPELRAGMEVLAETGQSIVDGVTGARVVDDATNQAQIAEAAGESGIAAWHTTYCAAP